MIRSKECQPMRPIAHVAIVGLLVSASSTFAQAPAQVYVPTQPTLMWASASANSSGGVSLRIRTVQYTNGVQEYKVTYPVTETSFHKGKPSQHTRMVEKREMRSVLVPIAGPVVEVPVNASGVFVYEQRGSLLAPSGVAQMLGRESAVLVSTTGPVNPYFVQTSPPGTPIVQLPSSMLYPTSVALTPAGSSSTELVPASAATPAPAIVVNYSEPPLAPTTPKKD